MSTNDQLTIRANEQKPTRGRWGLVVAAAWALAVNHLLLTEW